MCHRNNHFVIGKTLITDTVSLETHNTVLTSDTIYCYIVIADHIAYHMFRYCVDLKPYNYASNSI